LTKGKKTYKSFKGRNGESKKKRKTTGQGGKKLELGKARAQKGTSGRKDGALRQKGSSL